MSTNPFVSAQKQLQDAASMLRSDYSDTAVFDKAVQKLMEPDRVIKKELSVTMDNGSVQKFTAFRSQHNDARGPYKGGIRFHQQVSEEEVRALSMWMTWKCATTGIPYGGSKGGIIVDPSTLSSGELQKLSRAYAREFASHFGAWIDVPAPDVNTNGQIMSWMLDEYEKTVGHHEPGVFTGKPLELGGSEGREEATGQGGVYVLAQIAQKLGLKPQKTRIAVQGLGNVGYWFAKLAQDMGFVIVALSDSKGGILADDQTKGLDVAAVLKYKKDHKTVAGFAGTKSITQEELLSLPVEVLVPAALENVITGENARTIQAKVVVEMANGPVTPDADAVLWERGILSVPDVLSNAGGVTVSYFEWVQNLHGYSWKHAEVLAKLQPIMEAAFARMWELHESKKVPLRKAAYLVAVKRVVDAMILRGAV